jgi:hypothetical protein
LPELGGLEDREAFAPANPPARDARWQLYDPTGGSGFEAVDPFLIYPNAARNPEQRLNRFTGCRNYRNHKTLWNL